MQRAHALLYRVRVTGTRCSYLGLGRQTSSYTRNVGTAKVLVSIRSGLTGRRERRPWWLRHPCCIVVP
jgi:hypothetical protein